MELESVYTLSVLSRSVARPALDEDVEPTLVNEVADIKRSVALSHSCIVKHCKAITIP